MTIIQSEPPSVGPKIYEPEDLLRMPDAIAYELVDGKLVERKMGAESSVIAARIIFLLQTFLSGKRLGYVLESEASYQCFPDKPKKVRRADVSFIRMDRVPGGKFAEGHLRIAPDIAIEVVSPRDLAKEVQAKVVEYRSAGVPLVWVVYPSTRTVWVHRLRSTPQDRSIELSEDESISGEDVLPGFTLPVRSIFNPE